MVYTTLIGKSTNFLCAIFNSYVKLPEGNVHMGVSTNGGNPPIDGL
jgi:hypothetical protein